MIIDIIIFTRHFKTESNNITKMEGIFFRCLKIAILPDIFKWNTEKVVNIENIFTSCESLSSLPDLKMAFS